MKVHSKGYKTVYLKDGAFPDRLYRIYQHPDKFTAYCEYKVNLYPTGQEDRVRRVKEGSKLYDRLVAIAKKELVK